MEESLATAAVSDMHTIIKTAVGLDRDLRVVCPFAHSLTSSLCMDAPWPEPQRSLFKGRKRALSNGALESVE